MKRKRNRRARWRKQRNSDTLIPMNTEAPDSQENPRYLSEQVITYIGNKRALLPFIDEAVRKIRSELGGRKLSCFDAFSGSGIVSRYFKKHASHIIANDLELYSKIINTCYLTNRPDAEKLGLKEQYRDLTKKLAENRFIPGIISELYAPGSEDAIHRGERVFYTKRNALYLDTARTLIDEYPEEIRPFFLAPLLSEASVHANTAGVFKGFYKNRHTGIGQFGGHKGDALNRITGNIVLEYPVFSDFEGNFQVLQEDALAAACSVPETDLAYLDPPYNQHPYGSNYFMLNVLARNERPEKISPISGIPSNWNRSPYNRRKEAPAELRKLIERIRAKYVLVSFNSEGFVSREEMEEILSAEGSVETLETRYNAFRGSRNLQNRSKHVTEFLYILKKN